MSNKSYTPPSGAKTTAAVIFVWLLFFTSPLGSFVDGCLEMIKIYIAPKAYLIERLRK